MLRRAAIVLLALVAAPLLAQTADRPVPKAGDQWDFAVYYEVRSTTPNRTWIVRSVGPAIEATENGEPLLLTPELNVLDSPLQKESNPGALRFPLQVGKTWRFRSDWEFKPKNSKGTRDVEVSVVAYEKVSVPAGEFEAFKMVSKERLGGTAPIGSQYNAEAVQTYWYAPAARAIVKSTRHNPYLGTTSFELVRYRLQP